MIENTQPTSIQVGKAAPSFSAKAYVKGKADFPRIKLEDYKGKWVCLFFYPKDFTFVCPTEIRAFGQKEEAFLKQGCVVIGASTDNEFCHKAWFERDLPDVKFPILADLTHSVSQAYGVLIKEEGVALRGTFIIDPDGILQWSCIHSLGTGRSVEEVLRTLQALQTGELCPADWKPGSATLK